MFDHTRPHDCRRELFSGRGAVRVWNLAAGEPRAPFAAVLACELEPAGSVGTHVQEHFAEIVVVLEGRGTARVDGVPRPIEPGALVELPLGKTLALENGSELEPLRYLIIKAR
jgi:mannose-6-phosphate isomerase-like protein (cupin superfamily)